MARTNKVKVPIELDDELAGMFGSFDKRTASAKAAELKQTNFLKLGTGRHIIRILPGRKGSAPFSEVYQHMIKPPGGKMFSINCPQRMNGTHCPVCAHVELLRNSDVEVDKSLAKDMQAKLSISCNAIVRKEPQTGEGDIGVLRLPRGVYESILDLGSHEDVLAEYEETEDGFVDITHPTQGLDIRLEKSGSGLNTKYVVGVVARTHNTPMFPDRARIKEVLKGMTDLSVLTKIMSEDEISAKLMGPPGEAQPAIPERTAERAMHDTTADNVVEDEDEDKIPF